MILNVLDYRTPQEAIDDAADGDAIYFPGVADSFDDACRAPAGGYRIAKSLEIYGDGPGHFASRVGSVIVPFGDETDVFVIDPESGVTIHSVVIRDLKITAPDEPFYDPGGTGIKCVLGPNQRVRSIRIERVVVFNMRVAGYWFENQSGATDGIEMVAIVESGGSFNGTGVILEGVRSARLVHSALLGNSSGGIYCENSGVALYTPALDDNAGDDGATQGAILFLDCPIARVDAAHVEKFATGKSVPEGCRMSGCGGAAIIEGSMFTNDLVSPEAESTGVVVIGGGPVGVLPGLFERVAPKLIEIDENVDDPVVFPQFNNPGGYSAGALDMPGAPNNGALAMPYVRRGLGDPEDVAALVPPSGSGLPSIGIQDGMLFYDVSSNRLVVRIDGQWKAVEVEG